MLKNSKSTEKNRSSHRNMATRTLATCAMLVAISVILARVLAFAPDKSTRYSAEDLPIFISGLLFGPLPGALVGFVSDTIGALLFSGQGMMNPILSVPHVLFGISGGLFQRLLMKKVNPLTISLAYLPPIILGSILYQSFPLAYLKTSGGAAFWFELKLQLFSRSIQFAIMFVIYVILTYLLFKSRVFTAVHLWPPVNLKKTKKEEPTTMTLDEALHYIHSVCWKGSMPGLERISALLDKMGHPEQTMKYIHVTGTNGKGSTCAMLASMLRQAGYKVGLYTSPYIEVFNERIQVNGEMISDRDICEITAYIKPLADSIFEQPTEFEMVTALGFEYFARQKCDIVVTEVGMGGEFDATNVIPAPEVAVVCNIGLDHMEVLGDTLEKIAATKAGIFKPGCDAVIYRESKSVEDVFESRCKELDIPFHLADFDSLKPLSHNLEGQRFSWGRFEELKLPLLGAHQLHNAATALTAATVLQQRGWELTDEHIRAGLAEVQWPGRFELLRREPLFVADGGHNPQCIEALVGNIQEYLADRKLTVLTGVLADKDYNCMYANVAPYVQEFVTVTPGNPRALSAEGLAEYLQRFEKPVTACQTVAEGVSLAIEKAGADGAVLCYGSLYMLGEIKEAVRASL